VFNVFVATSALKVKNVRLFRSSNELFDTRSNLSQLIVEDLTTRPGNGSIRLPADFWAVNSNLERVSLSNVAFNFSFDVLPQLRHLRQLRSLEIRGNRLNSLPEDTFRQNSQLLRVSLTGSQLDDLPDGIFDALTQIEAIDLSGNRFERVPANLFQANSRCPFY
jgi:Leucine-rich repeat (LRR) protein